MSNSLQPYEVLSWKTNPGSGMFNLQFNLTTIVLVKLATGNFKHLNLAKIVFLFSFLFFLNKLVSLCPSSLQSFVGMAKGHAGFADRPQRSNLAFHP